MINKIIASYLLFACFIAIALKLGGVEGTVHLGDYFRGFLVESNRQLQDLKIAIPDIPKIDLMEDFVYDTGTWWDTILNAFHQFMVVLGRFYNGLITILNVVIMFLNTVIQVVELLFIFLKNLITMRDTIISA